MPSKLSFRSIEIGIVCLPAGLLKGTNPYCIEYECAAGECAANLQSEFCLFTVPPRDSLAVIRACVSLKRVWIIMARSAWGFCDTHQT